MNNSNFRWDRFQAIPTRGSRLQAGLANSREDGYKQTQRGFTLVELLIVIAVMMIMTGVLSQFWIGVERINRLASETSNHAMRGELLLERIGQDIRQAIRVDVNENRLPSFTQLHANGTICVVRYSIEGDELIRQETCGQETQTALVGRLRQGRLSVTEQNGSIFRLTWETDFFVQPGMSQTLTLVKSVRYPGGSS